MFAELLRQLRPAVDCDEFVECVFSWARQLSAPGRPPYAVCDHSRTETVKQKALGRSG